MSSRSGCDAISIGTLNSCCWIGRIRSTICGACALVSGWMVNGGGIYAKILLNGDGSWFYDFNFRYIRDMKKRWLLFFLAVPALGQAQKDSLVVDWGQTQLISKSVATLQVVVNPPLRRGSSIHDPSFAALAALG